MDFTKVPIPVFSIKECDGACLGQESVTSYNERVDEFLNKITFEKFTQLFEVAGRNENEKGLVYIEKGMYKGFGFCPLEIQQSNLLDFIETDHRDVRRILIRYLIKPLKKSNMEKQCSSASFLSQ